MGKIGKISVIDKDYSTSYATMETSLRLKGFSRIPGTGKFILPARSLSGKYITGLDEDSSSILNLIADNPKEGLRKQEEVKELRKKLEDGLGGIDLSATSDYYNFSTKGIIKVEPIKLLDQDNIFNLDIAKTPWQYVTWCWVSSHPTISSSLEAYERGEYPADTQFYVNDEDLG